VLLDAASSTSYHVVVSSQNTKHMCAMGTIKREIVKCSGYDESNARIPAGMLFSVDQLGTCTIPVIAEAADSDLKSNVAEKNQISESFQPLLPSNQNSSQVINPIQDDQQPLQLLNEPLKCNSIWPSSLLFLGGLSVGFLIKSHLAKYIWSNIF
jgi:hypothetical protein